MTELNIFPPEDTAIVLRKPDKSAITIDVLDLEALSHSLFNEAGSSMPFDEYVIKMCDAFETKYGYRMSIASMQHVIAAKNDKLEYIKKNTTTPLEPASATESNQEQPENSLD
jgi:hypothetical protein